MTTSTTQDKVINWLLLIFCVAILLYIEIIPYIRSGGGPPPLIPFDGMSMPERMAHMGMLFSQLPPWVEVWMKIQDVIIASSLFFLFFHKPVRIYVLGIILNHVFLFGLMPVIPGSLVSLEFPALSHFLWIPALFVFVRAWPKVDKSSAYGVWMTVAIFQLCFSLMFDIPHGLSFLAKLF